MTATYVERVVETLVDGKLEHLHGSTLQLRVVRLGSRDDIINVALDEGRGDARLVQVGGTSDEVVDFLFLGGALVCMSVHVA